jgi:hypothetical protein
MPTLHIAVAECIKIPCPLLEHTRPCTTVCLYATQYRQVAASAEFTQMRRACSFLNSNYGLCLHLKWVSSGCEVRKYWILEAWSIET